MASEDSMRADTSRNRATYARRIMLTISALVASLRLLGVLNTSHDLTGKVIYENKPAANIEILLSDLAKDGKPFLRKTESDKNGVFVFSGLVGETYFISGYLPLSCDHFERVIHLNRSKTTDALFDLKASDNKCFVMHPTN